MTSDARLTRTVELLADLASVSASAHTDATLVLGLADALARHVPVARATLEASDGRVLEVTPSDRRASGMALTLELGREVGTLRIELAATRSELDALVAWTDTLHAAITRIVRTAFAHARAMARVAAVSRRALGDSARLREELDRAATGDGIVAHSPAMRRIVQDIVPLVARQDVTVLLRGESGTGKELLARRIHASSPRSRRAFVAVNCGALPETLAESALFGHERGAFTGALQRHAGLFERAHGGTLLLDEVGELGAPMQARLLRVLQEGAFERVGGTSTVRVDVRVIAATHRPLEVMVADGRFREDLYYRLHVVPIEVPPLREREGDILPLARAALARLCARMERSEPAITPADAVRLTEHRWPGNVRELENVIARALVLTRGDVLELPPSFESAARRDAPVGPRAPERFDDAMRRVITDAIDACGGRIYGPDGAAARLGLPPTTLQSKIEKLGIRRTPR